jgi:glutamine synthetase
MHGGDRNRTSPFAFTGNKFEFRTLGSSMSLALPNTVLNTITAEAIDDLSDSVEKRIEAGETREQAVLAVVKETWAEHKRIVFGGDNYSEDWHAEAEARGLANLRQTPEALPWLIEPTTVEVFSRYEVLSERELHARYEVFVEQYATTINIEGETAASIARTMLLPAAVSWLGRLGAAEASPGVKRLKGEVTGLLDEFVEAIFALEEANLAHPDEGADVLAEARYVQGAVLPAMERARSVADRLERVVPDDLWPLPKYSEVLFIK